MTQTDSAGAVRSSSVSDLQKNLRRVMTLVRAFPWAEKALSEVYDALPILDHRGLDIVHQQLRITELATAKAILEQQLAEMRGDLSVARLQRDAKLCSGCPRVLVVRDALEKAAEMFRALHMERHEEIMRAALSSSWREEAVRDPNTSYETLEEQIGRDCATPPAQTPQTQGKCELCHGSTKVIGVTGFWVDCPSCTASAPAAEQSSFSGVNPKTGVAQWSQPAAERDIYECLCGAKVRKGKDMQEHDCNAAEREGEDDLHRAIVAYGNSQYDLAINNDPERLPILRERAKRSYDGLRALLGGNRE